MTCPRQVTKADVGKSVRIVRDDAVPGTAVIGVTGITRHCFRDRNGRLWSKGWFVKVSEAFDESGPPQRPGGEEAADSQAAV